MQGIAGKCLFLTEVWVRVNVVNFIKIASTNRHARQWFANFVDILSLIRYFSLGLVSTRVFGEFSLMLLQAGSDVAIVFCLNAFFPSAQLHFFYLLLSLED